VLRERLSSSHPAGGEAVLSKRGRGLVAVVALEVLWRAARARLRPRSHHIVRALPAREDAQRDESIEARRARSPVARSPSAQAPVNRSRRPGEKTSTQATARAKSPPRQRPFRTKRPRPRPHRSSGSTSRAHAPATPASQIGACDCRGWLCFVFGFGGGGWFCVYSFARAGVSSRAGVPA
jgi:hypothetical protein